MINPPATIAVSDNQKASTSENPKRIKYPIYESITEENLTGYHKISCKPITITAENDMELISDIVTWGERYLHHWKSGIYICSRCENPLYSSDDKYKGPCIWPSFRKPIHNDDSIHAIEVYPYNKYEVCVKEIYCKNCDLFIGHQFEDAKLKGDIHPNAHWRH
eukprot:gene11353-15224_t